MPLQGTPRWVTATSALAPLQDSAKSSVRREQRHQMDSFAQTFAANACVIYCRATTPATATKVAQIRVLRHNNVKRKVVLERLDEE